MMSVLAGSVAYLFAAPLFLSLYCAALAVMKRRGRFWSLTVERICLFLLFLTYGIMFHAPYTAMLLYLVSTLLASFFFPRQNRSQRTTEQTTEKKSAQ